LPRVDAGEQPGLTELADAIGIKQPEARAAAIELERSGYLSMRWMPQGGSGGPPQHGMVIAVHERARRTLGSWPSADTLVDQLAAALLAAADQADDPDEADLLRDAAGEIGSSVVKGVLVNVFTRLVLGLPD
jgi:hypothetical protein